MEPAHWMFCSSPRPSFYPPLVCQSTEMWQGLACHVHGSHSCNQTWDSVAIHWIYNGDKLYTNMGTPCDVLRGGLAGLLDWAKPRHGQVAGCLACWLAGWSG